MWTDERTVGTMSMLLAHGGAAAEAGGQIFGMALLGALALGLLAYAVLFIAALISIVASPHGMGMKVVWIVFAFIAPFIGSVLWFALGRRDAFRTA
ncbi:hypothetical protein GCM10023222_11220 [Saccharopolyspora cebuensis]